MLQDLYVVGMRKRRLVPDKSMMLIDAALFSGPNHRGADTGTAPTVCKNHTLGCFISPLWCFQLKVLASHEVFCKVLRWFPRSPPTCDILPLVRVFLLMCVSDIICGCTEKVESQSDKCFGATPSDFVVEEEN